MLTVSTAAATTKFTTVQAVKDELGITGDSEDSYLGQQIDRVSALICSYLGTVMADDGTCTIGRETLVETVRLRRCERALILSRWPIYSIASVTIDGEALATDGYEAEKAPGLLYRLATDARVHWPVGKMVVTYTAGWLLPGDADRNLPHDIEAVAIELIKGARSARTRDPLVKSVEIPDVRTVQYWVGGVGDAGSIPPDIAAKLDRYCRTTVA